MGYINFYFVSDFLSIYKTLSFEKKKSLRKGGCKGSKCFSLIFEYLNCVLFILLTSLLLCVPLFNAEYVWPIIKCIINNAMAYCRSADVLKIFNRIDVLMYVNQEDR